MHKRIEKASSIIMDLVRVSVRQTLAVQLDKTHSQEQWEQITEAVCGSIEMFLQNDLRLADALTEQDLLDTRGRINVEGIVQAFQELAAQDRPPGERARLEHLVRYLSTTCKDLKLHRR